MVEAKGVGLCNRINFKQVVDFGRRSKRKNIRLRGFYVHSYGYPASSTRRQMSLEDAVGLKVPPQSAVVLSISPAMGS